MQNRAAVVEWRCTEDFPTRFIVQQARAADIIVVGEDGRDALADPFMQANPSDLIMQLGRPLLVVPESGNWLDLRSILIAWKDTPEARRAIVDALPMLRKAKDVTVVEIIEDDVSRPAALSRVKDIVAWLSRHGVVASEQVPRECSQVVGLVSKFDFLACFVFTTAHMIPRYDDLMKQTVADIMTPDFIYVRVETKLTRVLQLMVDHRIRSIPVIEGDQRLVGMISREDVMRALQRCVSGKTQPR